MQDVLAQILADAEQRAGAAPRLVTSSGVTWREGSLGCPEQGMMYAMALVPGYLVIVEAGDQRLEYHASRAGHFVLCPPGRAKPPLENAAGPES